MNQGEQIALKFARYIHIFFCYQIFSNFYVQHFNCNNILIIIYVLELSLPVSVKNL